MELKDYFYILRKRAGWFIFTLACVGGVYAGVTLKEKVHYETASRILIRLELFDPYASISADFPIRQPIVTFATREELIKRPEVMQLAALLSFIMEKKPDGPKYFDKAFYVDAGKIKEKSDITRDDLYKICAELKISTATTEGTAAHDQALAIESELAIMKAGDRIQLTDLQIKDQDPVRAEAFANAVALAAQIMGMEEARGNALRVVAQLQESQQQKFAESDAITQKLKELGETSDDLRDRRRALYEQIRVIENDLARIEGELIRVGQRLQAAAEAVHREKTPFGAGMALGLPSSEASALESELRRLRSELHGELQVRTAEHTRVQELQAHIAELERQLSDVKERDLQREFHTLGVERQSLETNRNGIKADLAQKHADLTSLEQKLREYLPLADRQGRLQTELDRHTKSIEDLQRYVQMQQGYVTVSQWARRAARMASVQLTGWPFWLVVAILLGVGVAYLREYLDTVITSEYDVRRTLNLPVFGLVRDVRSDEVLLTQVPVKSPLSETFSTIATLIRSSMSERRLKVLAICSPNPQEGKTTIAVNLSIAFARKGLRTVVVDADMRIPTLHSVLGVDNARGLSTLLEGGLKPPAPEPPAEGALDLPGEPPAARTRVWDMLVPGPVENLYALPSGGTPANPARLIESSLMGQLIEELREESDIVIIDTPPLGSVSDALMLASRSDGAVLVLGSGITEQREASWAKHLLTNVHAKVLGVVLNRCKRPETGEYYYYYTSDRRSVRRGT